MVTYKPEEILRIQMFFRILENDALGRYIHDPEHLDDIMRVLGLTQGRLREIITDASKACASGYIHVDCACVPIPAQPSDPTG